MKTYLDCIPCFFKQALEAARMATNDEEKQRKVLDRVAGELPRFSLDGAPAEIGSIVYKIVHEITGDSDPYKKVKERYNRIALSLYPKLKQEVEWSADRLLTAIRIAIAGNIIDFVVGAKFDVEKELQKTLTCKFAIFDYAEFKRLAKKAENILYLADNAGETVFDRVLIEELDKKVIYAVKEAPIINDATLEDAKFCEIDKVAKVISSGSDAPGTILGLCSKEFLAYYNQADLIISKGQGNYETLSEERRPIFFLLKAKCPIIAQNIGVTEGSIILMKG
ncbi:MAG TPA: DUF89 family protein [bacterium (Candidatus Stahlbacteria)]|nr:DUF89 family protein [Candidatus Stahlbacteria bacterium]